MNTATGNISGTPSSPGTFTVTLTCSNACGTGTATLNLMITGSASPDSTPWPVNLARKGTVAFADLTTLPSTPTVITPTTPVGSMSGFPRPYSNQQVNGMAKLCYDATADFCLFRQPLVSLGLAQITTRDIFLGRRCLSTHLSPQCRQRCQNERTDQGTITRQELIKLQRTIGFSQSLLQYLGTFSRERNRPAPNWPQLNGKLPARWDMNNLAIVIPDSWIFPGNHGVGHAYGLQRHSEIAQLFGLVWENGTFAPGTRFTDPNYYGRWKYTGRLTTTTSPRCQANPDFFQIIDYAMNQAIGAYADPNHVRNTFTIGAALIDQYDTDDLYDATQPGGGGNMATLLRSSTMQQ